MFIDFLCFCIALVLTAWEEQRLFVVKCYEKEAYIFGTCTDDKYFQMESLGRLCYDNGEEN